MSENERGLRGQINEQVWILNSVNDALRARQHDKESFKDGVARVWNALYTEGMRDRVVELLDDELPGKNIEEIRDYNRDGHESSFDLFNCLEDVFEGPKLNKKIKASEILLRKIQKVLVENGVIGRGREMPETSMRRRTLTSSKDKKEVSESEA